MDWSGKKVLVTGAGGFIGSHLSERLVELGANVRAMVHYNALGSWGWLGSSDKASQMEVLMGDIGDFGCVEGAVKGCDVIFHLGALIAIPYSYRAPNSYVHTNIQGTMNVLQAVRMHDVGRMIHTSTSEVYGTAKFVPITEDHPLQGQSPYSASKIGADKMAESFYLSFGTPVVTVRPFNTFGPRQSARAVIPTIITQCLAGNEVKLGNLTPTRDLNYVSNTVDGFVKAAEVPAAIGQTINLGTGREISVGDLACMIADMIGSGSKVAMDKERLRPANSEVERLLADNTKAKEVLGWSPAVNLEDGLAKSIEWFKEHRHLYRSEIYNV